MQYSLWFHADFLFGNLLELGFFERLKWHFGIVSGCELKFILAFSCCSFTQWRSDNEVLLTGILLDILIQFKCQLTFIWFERVSEENVLMSPW